MSSVRTKGEELQSFLVYATFSPCVSIGKFESSFKNSFSNAMILKISRIRCLEDRSNCYFTWRRKNGG